MFLGVGAKTRWARVLFSFVLLFLLCFFFYIFFGSVVRGMVLEMFVCCEVLDDVGKCHFQVDNHMLELEAMWRLGLAGSILDMLELNPPVSFSAFQHKHSTLAFMLQSA